MKIAAAMVFGVASLFSAQAALADNVVSYDVTGYLFWHQTQDDGAPTALTGKLTYDFTTNLFTQTDVEIGPYQFSMNALPAPYTNRIVWHAVGIDEITTCDLPAGQTCPNGVLSGNFMELSIQPLMIGPTASHQYTGSGAVPFQFQALLGTSGPTPDGNPVFAEYIGAGTIAAVPEPETCALMLAGLGLLGFLGRRRQVTH